MQGVKVGEQGRNMCSLGTSMRVDSEACTVDTEAIEDR